MDKGIHLIMIIIRIITDLRYYSYCCHPNDELRVLARLISSLKS